MMTAERARELRSIFMAAEKALRHAEAFHEERDPYEKARHRDEYRRKASAVNERIREFNSCRYRVIK